MRTGEHDQLLRQGRQGWRGGCDGWRLCEIGTTLRARGVREVCLQKHGSVSSPCGGVPPPRRHKVVVVVVGGCCSSPSIVVQLSMSDRTGFNIPGEQSLRAPEPLCP